MAIAVAATWVAARPTPTSSPRAADALPAEATSAPSLAVSTCPLGNRQAGGRIKGAVRRGGTLALADVEAFRLRADRQALDARPGTDVVQRGEVVAHADLEPDGAVRIEGLDPEEPVETWGQAPAGGLRYVHERLPGFGVEQVRIETRPGRPIRVRPRCPPDRKVVSVTACVGGRCVEGHTLPNGDYECPGLPEGRYVIEVEVSLRPWEAEGEWRGRAEASPGDTVDVEVRRAYGRADPLRA